MVYRKLNHNDPDDPGWDRHKQAWQLRQEGKTYQEIADIMGFRGRDWPFQLVRQWERMQRRLRRITPP